MSPRLLLPEAISNLCTKAQLLTAGRTPTVTSAVVHVTNTITPALVIVYVPLSPFNHPQNRNKHIHRIRQHVNNLQPLHAHGSEGKRAAPTIPPYLKGYAAGRISTACSCPCIPTKATTVTTTIGTNLAASALSATNTAATPTATSTSTTTTVSVAQFGTIYLAICAPSAMSITSDVLSSEGNASPNEISNPATTAIDCCVACFNALNCLSCFFSPNCALFVLAQGPEGDPAPANAAQAALCPIGVSTQDTLFPTGISSDPDPTRFMPGSCVMEADPLL